MRGNSLDFKAWTIQEGRAAHYLATHYPNDFLGYETIYVKPNGELLTIGLFKCTICGRPIIHNQYAFSRCCGSCDVGKTNPKWVIEVPSEIRDQVMKDAELVRLAEENAYRVGVELQQNLHFFASSFNSRKKSAERQVRTRHRGDRKE